MIREVTQNDFATIYQLGEQLHSNYQQTYHLNELLQEPYFNILVYEENNQVVAFLSYTKLYNTVDIIDLIVQKEYRNHKIATNLIDYLITGLEVNTNIYLEVDVNNKAAINLYQKFGFQKIHTRKNYYEESDAYVMERVI